MKFEPFALLLEALDCVHHMLHCKRAKKTTNATEECSQLDINCEYSWSSCAFFFALSSIGTRKILYTRCISALAKTGWCRCCRSRTFKFTCKKYFMHQITSNKYTELKICAFDVMTRQSRGWNVYYIINAANILTKKREITVLSRVVKSSIHYLIMNNCSLNARYFIFCMTIFFNNVVYNHYEIYFVIHLIHLIHEVIIKKKMYIIMVVIIMVVIIVLMIVFVKHLNIFPSHGSNSIF